MNGTGSSLNGQSYDSQEPDPATVAPVEAPQAVTDTAGPDASVGLAIGLGWQLALIYLAITRPEEPSTQAGAPGANSASAPPLGTPAVSMMARTVASRARSLGLGADGPTPGWVHAMDSLVGGAALGDDEASRLARELHLGLVEALSKQNDRLRPAYELGRLLSETVVVATGAPEQRRCSVYRQLFDPLRLLPLADWLALLESALPTGAGYAVFASLQRWSRWVVAASDPELLRSSAALREQGRLWRDLLLDRPIPVTPSGAELATREAPGDTATARATVGTGSGPGPTITQSLADISMTAAFTARRADRPPLFDAPGLAVALALADAVTRLPDALEETLGAPIATPVAPEVAEQPIGLDELAADGALVKGTALDHGEAEGPSLDAALAAGEAAWLEKSDPGGALLTVPLVEAPTPSIGFDRPAPDAPGPLEPATTGSEAAAYTATAPRRVRRMLVRDLKHSTRAQLKVVATVAAAAGAVLLLRAYVAAPFYVPTASMTPTLAVGDRMLVDKVTGPVHRGDIIVFHNESPIAGVPVGADLVKRVIGLPGDRISSVGEHVYINGAPLNEPWLPTQTGICNQGAFKIRTQVVPKGRFFVMGDCRGDSNDSRYFGAISSSTVVGKVFVVVWHSGHPWFHWF